MFSSFKIYITGPSSSTFEVSTSLAASPNTSSAPQARPLGELSSKLRQLHVPCLLPSLTYLSQQNNKVHAKNHICRYSLRESFATDEDDLDTVVTELQDVSDVMKLGLVLGIRKSALDRIMQDKANLEDRKIEVIHYWLTRRDIVRQRQGECPGWNALAVAVARVNPALSQRIQRQHC